MRGVGAEAVLFSIVLLALPAPATCEHVSEPPHIIVVVGATGQQGGAVARELLGRGYAVRAITRSPDKPAAAQLALLGADIVKADLEAPESLDQAFAGAYGLFAMTEPWERGPAGEVRHGHNMIEAAKRAAIKHLVLSSVSRADRGTGIPHFDSKGAVERELRLSGMAFTIVRPVSFMENWNRAAQELAGGELQDALKPTTRVQYIAVSDIARFVAEAFDHPTHWMGRAIDIAGHELTLPQVAAVLSGALGHKVVYRQISWNELRSRRGTEIEVMKRWMDAGGGYGVDIQAMRREFPWLQTFEDYVRGRNWSSQD